MQFDAKMHRSHFVESPFFSELIKQNDIDEYYDNLIKLNKDGYCILDIDLSKKVIDQANKDIDNALEKKIIKQILLHIIIIKVLGL